jgi:hypothetical protein
MAATNLSANLKHGHPASHGGALEAIATLP